MELTKSKWLYLKEQMILSTNKTRKFWNNGQSSPSKNTPKNTIILRRIEKKWEDKMRFYWDKGSRQNSLFRWSRTMTITSCPQWIVNEVEQWGIDQRIDQNGLFDYDKNRFQSVKNDFILYNTAKLFCLKEYC